MKSPPTSVSWLPPPEEKFTRNDFRPWTEMRVKFTQWTCFHRTPVCILVLLPSVITLWDLPSYPPPVMPADTIFPPTQTYNLSSGAQTLYPTDFHILYHSNLLCFWPETNLGLLFSNAIRFSSPTYPFSWQLRMSRCSMNCFCMV